MENKYFARYIPSENKGEDTSDLYFFKINDHWTKPANFDDYLGPEIQEVKLARLFVCSKDFKVGDMIMDEDFCEWMVKDNSDPHSIYCIDEKGGSKSVCVVSNCTYKNADEDVFKVIGPVFDNANIGEGCEFNYEVAKVLIKNFSEV